MHICQRSLEKFGAFRFSAKTRPAAAERIATATDQRRRREDGRRRLRSDGDDATHLPGHLDVQTATKPTRIRVAQYAPVAAQIKVHDATPDERACVLDRSSAASVVPRATAAAAAAAARVQLPRRHCRHTAPVGTSHIAG